jgi:hypothetical protein
MGPRAGFNGGTSALDAQLRLRRALIPAPQPRRLLGPARELLNRAGLPLTRGPSGIEKRHDQE